MWHWGQCSGPTSKLLRHKGQVMAGTLQGNRSGPLRHAHGLTRHQTLRRSPAESLFEAAVLAVSAFRKAGWVEAPLRVASRLEIEVREPVVKHTVTVAQLQRWPNHAMTSPAGKRKMRPLGRSLSRFGGGAESAVASGSRDGSPSIFYQ